jgi:hypothetical protein
MLGWYPLHGLFEVKNIFSGPTLPGPLWLVSPDSTERGRGVGDRVEGNGLAGEGSRERARWVMRGEWERGGKDVSRLQEGMDAPNTTTKKADYILSSI